MSDGPRINEAIRAASVRCIDPEGEQLGILSLDEALRKAEELGLDLVESQQTQPPHLLLSSAALRVLGAQSLKESFASTGANGAV
ncbi:MAG: hypothetical protein VW417_00565, partial [Alphaproteobacteria bacterium]